MAVPTERQETGRGDRPEVRSLRLLAVAMLTIAGAASAVGLLAATDLFLRVVFLVLTAMTCTVLFKRLWVRCVDTESGIGRCETKLHSEPMRGQSRNGFTLVEIAVVLVIISVLMGGGVAIIRATIDSLAYDITQERMDRLQETLRDYARAFGYLPCPANITVPTESAAYGDGTGSAASCTGSCSAPNFADGDTVAGMVPTKTLRLPDELGVDGWGRRIVYAVDRRLTAADGISQFQNDPTIGTITIRDDAGGIRTGNAIYALVSHGPNGHGGFPIQGGTLRRQAGSTDADELENCDCDADALPTGFNSTFVQKEPTANFDDLARFVEYWFAFGSTDYGPDVCSCTLPWGCIIPSGGLATAYASPVALPGLCQSETRSCDSGTLSGSYTYQCCTEIGNGAGLHVDGAGAGDGSGSGVAVGDINGDGVPDLIVSASYADLGGPDSGAVHVVFGKTCCMDDLIDLNLNSLDGTSGFTLIGEGNGVNPGINVWSGDFNDDNIDDILIQHWWGNSTGGGAYVIFGHKGPWAASANIIDLLNGTQGARIDWSWEQFAGGGTVGELNNDGITDIVVTEYYKTVNGWYGVGTVFVLFGRSGVWPATVNLDALNGTDGFRIDGEGRTSNHVDNFGWSISIGNVNGDAYGDLIIGAPHYENGDDASGYVIFGKAGGWAASQNVSSLTDGTQGFRLQGQVCGGYCTYLGMGTGAPDLNKDGFADAAFYGGPEHYIYVVFGKAGGWPPVIDYTNLIGTGSNGFKIDLSGPGNGLSIAPYLDGDLNGDGYADLAFGDYQYDFWAGPENKGRTYVVYSKSTAWPDTFDITTVDGSTGFVVTGANNGDNSGSVMVVKDVNGDGFTDVVIGAPGADPGARGDAGSTYVVFGTDQPWPASIDLGSLSDPVSANACPLPSCQ